MRRESWIGDDGDGVRAGAGLGGRWLSWHFLRVILSIRWEVNSTFHPRTLPGPFYSGYKICRKSNFKKFDQFY